MNDGLLILRAIAGPLITAHGAQKLFGWLGGYGLAGTAGFFETLGFRPGRRFAAAAGTAEFLGGLLIAVGLLGPVGPALVLTAMIVAIVAVHWQNGLFVTTNGVELPLLYGTTAAALALTGPGAYSLDAALGLAPVWTPDRVWGALGISIVAAAGNLAARRSAPVEV